MIEHYCSICSLWISSRKQHRVTYSFLSKKEPKNPPVVTDIVCGDCFYKLSLLKEVNDFSEEVSYNIMSRIFDEPQGNVFLSWAAFEAWEKLFNASRKTQTE